jgi:NAD(P)-dependent dehydrogenase (short-subunit alcohol dehydrogenase family)
MSQGRLAGKVAVITGGASGIGAATVRRFVDEGASVVIADVQVSEGTALAEELGSSCRFSRTDVTREEDVARTVDFAVDTFGQLDVMFNNAGILGAMGPIARSQMDDVDLTFAVILRGTFLGMKHAARVMVPRGEGVILSTSSPAGVIGGFGAHAYSAAKAGVIGLTQSVAAELRPKGVRVNCIVPGAIVTAMTADLTVGDPQDLAGANDAMKADALMSRPGLPEDIAAGALYLASDDAAFVTGHTLAIDAGMTSAIGPSPFAQGPYEEPIGILEGGRRTDHGPTKGSAQ